MKRPIANTQPSRTWPGRKRRDPRIGIVISVASLALMAALALMISRSEPQVTKISVASALDNSYEPVSTTDTFKPGDSFYVSAKIVNYRSDEVIKARWRLNGDKIDETALQTHDTVGDITAGFSLSSPRPWPAGRYTVEIMYGDKVLTSADFRVE